MNIKKSILSKSLFLCLVVLSCKQKVQTDVNTGEALIPLSSEKVRSVKRNGLDLYLSREGSSTIQASYLRPPTPFQDGGNEKDRKKFEIKTVKESELLEAISRSKGCKRENKQFISDCALDSVTIERDIGYDNYVTETFYFDDQDCGKEYIKICEDAGI